MQPDWSNQIITIYLIGQFKPVKWYDIISLVKWYITSRVSFLFTAWSHWYPHIICNNISYPARPRRIIVLLKTHIIDNLKKKVKERNAALNKRKPKERNHFSSKWNKLKGRENLSMWFNVSSQSWMNLIYLTRPRRT